MCDLTTHLLTEVEVDQVLSLPLGVDISLSAGNSAFSILVNCSEIFKQEALGRKSGLHSFVNKAGSKAVYHYCCLEFVFICCIGPSEMKVHSQPHVFYCYVGRLF